MSIIIVACVPGLGKGQTTDFPTGNLAVTADIVAGCGLINGGAGSGLNFGTINYGTLPAIMQGQVNAMTVGGSLQVECSPNVVISVSIDAGGHESTEGQRNLAGPGGALVPYRLFFDEAKTMALDVGQVLTTAATGIVTVPIYGQATLNGSAIPPGTYSDVARVTLTY